MATVTGLTSARMLEIENASVVNGYIDELGHLILITKAGTTIDAGPITTFLATEEAAGGVELATSTETLEGTDNQRAVTPAGLFSVIGGFQGYRYLTRVFFTSSGSFVKANYPDLKAIRVRVVGGGGGGAGCTAGAANEHSSGGGGGGGGAAEKFILASALAESETVTVGAGGSAGPTTGATAGVGGTSAFGTHASAFGGEGGEAFASNSLPLTALGGRGGGSSLGDLLMTGGNGHAGGGGGAFGHGGAGGNSIMGGGGNATYTPANAGSNPGATGRIYGGGGGAASSNSGGIARVGGTGAPGIVVVEVFV